jgi:hypothetical protein
MSSKIFYNVCRRDGDVNIRQLNFLQPGDGEGGSVGKITFLYTFHLKKHTKDGFIKKKFLSKNKTRYIVSGLATFSDFSYIMTYLTFKVSKCVTHTYMDLLSEFCVLRHASAITNLCQTVDMRSRTKVK